MNGASRVALGVDLSRAHPALWRDIAQAADAMGYESLWLPEHLIMPSALTSAPSDDVRHRGVDTRTPMFDVFAMLSWLAASTSAIRLGTNIYNIGLRHPFVTARGLATLDLVSGGRAELGVGASWLAEEWAATGLDFASRGGRVDEAIEVCRRLWTLPACDFHGEHFDFDDVVFEPKPAQAAPRIHIGGDSRRALRRVAERGDGWLGMIHEPQSFARGVAVIAELCEQNGRDLRSIQCTASVQHPSEADVTSWADAGANRLIVSPWESTSAAVAGLERLAARVRSGPWAASFDRTVNEVRPTLMTQRGVSDDGAIFSE